MSASKKSTYVKSARFARREFVLSRACAKYDKHPRIVVAPQPIATNGRVAPVITETPEGGAWVQAWVYLSSADLAQ